MPFQKEVKLRHGANSNDLKVQIRDLIKRQNYDGSLRHFEITWTRLVEEYIL